MFIGYVYRHHIINESHEEKSYIGIVYSRKENVDRKPTNRWHKDGLGYKPKKDRKESTKFWNAIQKYGWNSFEHDILLKIQCETFNELLFWLNSFEQFYIEKYDSFYNGYNSTLGGDGTRGVQLFGEKNPMYGKPHTEETKQKIGDLNRGRKHTEEERKKMSESQKIAQLGHVVSDETRKKISVSQKERFKDEKEREKISKARKGKKLTEQHKQNIKENAPRGAQHKRARKVVCIETGEVFDTTCQAAETYGVSRGMITMCCKGERKSAKGKHFEYYKEEENKDE